MEPAELKRRLDKSIDEHGFSGVIYLHQGDTVLYERAAGYADRSNRIPNTLETRFGIASGTKFLTALAIGRLIEAGKLSFSTRLTDCVTLDLPRYSSEITIRHLLTHTSGIPDYFDEEKVTDFENFTVGIPWYDLKGPRDYLAVFPEEEMKFTPGERFCYSNSGYILLGIVIEELSGLKYQDFVQREIFDLAGMTQSGFFSLDRLPEKTAQGYIQDEEGWRTNVFSLPIVGASDGGAFSTVHDIAALWRAFWAGNVLSIDFVDLFSRPFVKVEGKPTYYGHGLWIREDEGREIYFSGCDAGVSFKSSVNLMEELQITVMSNTTDGAWPLLRDLDTFLRSGAESKIT